MLTAHEHTYARMCRLKRGVCAAAGEDAPLYIVDGTAGAYTGSGAEGSDCTLPRPPFDAVTEAKDCMWGWSTVEANATSLTWQHKRWSTGETVDAVTLTKGHLPGPAPAPPVPSTPCSIASKGHTCVSQTANLGNDLPTPESCAARAQANAECNGYFMYSQAYWSSWGCRCCADAEVGKANSNWDMYRYA